MGGLVGCCSAKGYVEGGIFDLSFFLSFFLSFVNLV